MAVTHDADGDFAQRIKKFRLSEGLKKGLARKGPVVRVPVQNLFQGGGDGLEGAYFYMFCIYPIQRNPACQAFQAYATDKDGFLASDLSATPYFAPAIDVRDRGRSGLYFGTKTQAQIIALMRRKSKGFDAFRKYNPVRVRKVKDSDNYYDY